MTIINTTTPIAVGKTIAGMYSTGGGSCLDYAGTITAAERDGNHYRLTVEFTNGTVRQYNNVRLDGESDYTLPAGKCSDCGATGTVFGLGYNHTCK